MAVFGHLRRLRQRDVSIPAAVALARLADLDSRLDAFRVPSLTKLLQLVFGVFALVDGFSLSSTQLPMSDQLILLSRRKRSRAANATRRSSTSGEPSMRRSCALRFLVGPRSVTAMHHQFSTGAPISILRLDEPFHSTRKPSARNTSTIS